MILTKALNREYGKTASFNLDHIVEKFTCSRIDVHALEGQDNLDLIPPFSCQFSPVSPHLVAVADEDGGVAILDSNQAGIQAVLQSWRAHENAIFDLEWMPCANRLVTASGDQKLIMWDVACEEQLQVFKGHSSSVRTVKHRDKFVFASGARDGHVMIWDSRSKSKDGCVGAINTIKNAHAFEQLQGSVKKRRSLRSNQDSQQSVTSVIFQDDYTLFSAGSVDGSIKVWDLRKTYTTMKMEAVPKHKLLYGGSSIRLHGFSHLVLDSSKTRLFASCMDNIVYMYNSTSLSCRPVQAYKGHKASSFYIRLALSPDDMYLLSGSSDSNGYIWRVEGNRSSPMVLKGHSGEVSGVDWCPTDISKLVTLGDDCTVRLWRLHPGKAHPSAKVDQEIIAGTCEKTRKEKGVNAQSQTSPLTSPRSPYKGAMIAPSPVTAMSPSLHSSLLHLPSSSRSPGSPMTASPRLISPSITRWFRTAGLKSPPGQSPRKLEVLFSPRKSGTPGKLAVPIPSVCSPLPGPSTATPSRRGQKRKLTYENAENEDHARKRLINDENRNVAKGSMTPISPAHSGTEHRVLRNHVNKLHTPCQKKLEFGSAAAQTDNDDCYAFLETPITFSSPTVNLPNYVFDPKPRTPRAKPSLENNKEMEVDWLTKIRIDLANETPEKSGLQACNMAQASPRTPVSSITRSASKLRSSTRGERSSPRLAKTPTQGRKISHYFSASPASKSTPVKRTDTKKNTESPQKNTNSPVVKKTDSPVLKKTDSPAKRRTESPSKRKMDSPTKRKTDSPNKDGSSISRLGTTTHASSPLAKKS